MNKTSLPEWYYEVIGRLNEAGGLLEHTIDHLRRLDYENAQLLLVNLKHQIVTIDEIVRPKQ